MPKLQILFSVSQLSWVFIPTIAVSDFGAGTHVSFLFGPFTLMISEAKSDEEIEKAFKARMHDIDNAI